MVPSVDTSMRIVEAVNPEGAPAVATQDMSACIAARAVASSFRNESMKVKSNT